MQIFVRGPGNSTVVLDISAEETVLALKRLMWAQTRIPVERQWLECGGRILHDEVTLGRSGVGEEATIWCHLRIGGEGCQICSRNHRIG